MAPSVHALGRVAPVASVGEQLVPAPIAGLPDAGFIVFTGPPLS